MPDGVRGTGDAPGPDVPGPAVDVTVPLPNEERLEHRTRDGIVLRALAWSVEEPRGRVQLVHGRGEHLGRYRELVAWLNRAGFSVFGHDHRDHGRSGGDQGAPGVFGQLVGDVAELRSRADTLAPGPGRPVLLAHSLGGLVAIRLLQESMADPRPVVSTPGGMSGTAAAGAGDSGSGGTEPAWSGLILSAPWLKTAVEIPFRVRLLIPVLRLVAPGWAVPQTLRPELLTRDPERAREVARDPLMLRGVAVRFFDEAKAAQERALAAGLPSGLPTLILIPEDDELVDPATTRAWAARLGPAAEVRSLPGTRHEPFNDVGRNIIFQGLVQWLDALFQREEEGR